MPGNLNASTARTIPRDCRELFEQPRHDSRAREVALTGLVRALPLALDGEPAATAWLDKALSELEADGELSVPGSQRVAGASLQQEMQRRLALATGGSCVGMLDGMRRSAEPAAPGPVLSLMAVFAWCRSTLERHSHTDAELQRLRARLEDEPLAPPQSADNGRDFPEIIGRSQPMLRVLKRIKQVAPTEATVLIEGETGTGKELIAQAIHARSTRHARRMIKINCAALPAGLMESELFGREKGAYTGAVSRQAGRFEAANGSTLFLDEIGELPMDAQVKLLRVLQEGEFERLGSNVTQRVNVRVVAATNRDLAGAVRRGSFREDLYYRLGVFPVRLPPLRERTGDLPQLTWSFVHEFAESMGRCVESISRKSMAAMEAYPWPGNIRELRNMIERAMIVSDGPVLELDAFDLEHGQPADVTNLEEIERRHILAVLSRTNWRVRGARGAAELVGLKPTTLESRMLKLGIRRPAA